MQQVDYTNIADLRAAADIIDESDGLTTYLGFYKPAIPNPATTPAQAKAAAHWAILKIVQSGVVKPIETQMLWANGMCIFNMVWNNRAALTYTFKNF